MMAETPPVDYRIRRRTDEVAPVAAVYGAAPVAAPVVDIVLAGLRSSVNSSADLQIAHLEGLTYDAERGDRFLRLFSRIERLRTLGRNWDGYGAEAPNPRAIFLAQRILAGLMHENFPPDSVTPSVENGIGLSFRRGDRYADIECFNSGEILAVTSDGTGDPYVWNVSTNRDDIERAIERIRLFIEAD